MFLSWQKGVTLRYPSRSINLNLCFASPLAGAVGLPVLLQGGEQACLDRRPREGGGWWPNSSQHVGWFIAWMGGHYLALGIRPLRLRVGATLGLPVLAGPSASTRYLFKATIFTPCLPLRNRLAYLDRLTAKSRSSQHTTSPSIGHDRHSEVVHGLNASAAAGD